MSPLSVVASTWSYLPFGTKNQNEIFDNSKMDQSIQLTLRALDEDCRGDADLALDTYFEALSCMLDALPQSQDAKRNKLIQHKLSTLLARKFETLNPVLRPGLRHAISDSNLRIRGIDPFEDSSQLRVTEVIPENQSTSLSEKVIQAAVAGAVALKQSPIPDAVCSGVGFTLKRAQALDKYIGVQDLCWNVSKVGINKAIELDAQFKLHEKVSTALMTSATAVIKAGIAYKEASSYQELKRKSMLNPQT